MRARIVVVTLCLALLAPVASGCEGCDVSAADGGVPLFDAGPAPLADAGAFSDAGVVPDGGPGPDAGSFADGGGSPDGGQLDDAGGLDDAGALVDGGRDDASVSEDGGPAADASAHEADGGDDDPPPCPESGLAIRLTWSTVGDVDLHLSLEGGAWCSDADCYWANCTPDSVLSLEWDNVDGHSAGDPVLLYDDDDGHGPEVLCVEDPFIAEYVVGVRYNPYSAWPATVARVEVFSFGVAVDDISLDGLLPDELWEPGSVVVSANGVSFVVEQRRCEGADDWLCQDTPGTCPLEP